MTSQVLDVKIRDQEQRQTAVQQVIFEAFALLLSRPVHEETDLRMHHENGDHHVRRDAERRNGLRSRFYRWCVAAERCRWIER